MAYGTASLGKPPSITIINTITPTITNPILLMVPMVLMVLMRVEVLTVLIVLIVVMVQMVMVVLIALIVMMVLMSGIDDGYVGGDDGFDGNDTDGMWVRLWPGGESGGAETINVFSLASGHLYERFLKIMMLSVVQNTKNPVKFWLLKNFLSPKFKVSDDDGDDGGKDGARMDMVLRKKQKSLGKPPVVQHSFFLSTTYQIRIFDADRIRDPKKHL